MKPKELFILLTSIREPKKFILVLRQNKIANTDYGTKK